MLGYELLLFVIKIETSTRGTNSMPFLPFRRGSFNPHRESFSVRGHLRSNLGIISGLGIICGAVWRREMFGSWGQFLEGHEKFFHPENHIKISNLFYLLAGYQTLGLQGCFVQIFHENRGYQSLHTRIFRRVQLCVFIRR